MDEKKEMGIKEERVRKIVHLYYSRPEVQEYMVKFGQNREISPQFFQGFGKRPDILEYPNDVLAMVKKGATSFHCSEELWEDPMKIVTGMSEEQSNELRVGWDLLLDIDSKYIDYSKIMANEIVNVLKFHGVKKVGLKFSGSKGFHLIVPWKAFPKVVNGIKTSDMFPEWPRIVLKYISEKVNPQLVKEITKLSTLNKYIKDYEASKEVIPDLVLVSPRHLFRLPYSLHEKTSLASAVIDADKVFEFELRDADPLKVKVREFVPDVKEGEASELLMQALDWWKENSKEENKEVREFKPIKLDNLSEKNFPPCVQNILKGIDDGRKRGVFVLLNFFRSLGMDRDEIEKRIYDWNEKNKVPLKKGYIVSQLSWSYRRKQIMPSNCKEFYEGIGVCIADDFCKRIKNPVNYTVRKTFIGNRNEAEKKKIEKKEAKKAEKKESKKKVVKKKVSKEEVGKTLKSVPREISNTLYSQGQEKGTSEISTVGKVEEVKQ